MGKYLKSYQVKLPNPSPDVSPGLWPLICPPVPVTLSRRRRARTLRRPRLLSKTGLRFFSS